MLITPEYVFKDVTHITPEWLAAKGITALVPSQADGPHPQSGLQCPVQAGSAAHRPCTAFSLGLATKEKIDELLKQI